MPAIGFFVRRYIVLLPYKCNHICQANWSLFVYMPFEWKHHTTAMLFKGIHCVNECIFKLQKKNKKKRMKNDRFVFCIQHRRPKTIIHHLILMTELRRESFAQIECISCGFLL